MPSNLRHSRAFKRGFSRKTVFQANTHYCEQKHESPKQELSPCWGLNQAAPEALPPELACAHSVLFV
jgi:hypothetical protein